MNPEKQSNETISSRSACILACNQTEREQQSLSQLSSFGGGKNLHFQSQSLSNAFTIISFTLGCTFNGSIYFAIDSTSSEMQSEC